MILEIWYSSSGTTREEFWEVLQYYTHLSGHLSMSKLVSLMLALFFEVCICWDTTLLPNLPVSNFETFQH